jgi:hypothetical protein
VLGSGARRRFPRVREASSGKTTLIGLQPLAALSDSAGLLACWASQGNPASVMPLGLGSADQGVPSLCAVNHDSDQNAGYLQSGSAPSHNALN